jgi:hypothetical protein
VLAGQDITELEKKALEAAEAMQKRGEELKSVPDPTETLAVITEEVANPAAVTTTTTTSTSTPTSAVKFTSPLASAILKNRDEEYDTDCPVRDGSDGSFHTDMGEDEDMNSKGTATPMPTPVPPLLDPTIFDDDDSVYLGLHVYTNVNAPSVVSGQLRHEMGVGFSGLAVTGL